MITQTRSPYAKRSDETYDQWAHRIGPMPDHLVQDIRRRLHRDHAATRAEESRPASRAAG